MKQGLSSPLISSNMHNVIMDLQIAGTNQTRKINLLRSDGDKAGVGMKLERSSHPRTTA